MSQTKDQKITEALERGVENIYPTREDLEKALQSGKKLRIYNGIDPTGKLHIGHGVILNKLRQFQELGCEIILLTGDFTAMIGDPTDKSATRKPLTRKEVLANAKGYEKQIGKILDPKKTKFKFNSKWLDKMDFREVVELASEFTVQRLSERDMFENRIKEGKPIHLHEFLYPIMQGYDSVAMDVDMEIGGSDQTFNMLAGRTLMKSLKNKEKFVLTMKLLEDPTGAKMSTTGNSKVNLSDEPSDMYGKIMSWTDGMIVPAFEIASNVPWEMVRQIESDLKKGENPKKFKMILAYKIVEMYHGKKAADLAEDNFKKVFEDKSNPDDIPEFEVKDKNIIEFLAASGMSSSKSEARRVIQQGGIKVNGKVVQDDKYQVSSGEIIQKGKRHFGKIK